MSRLAIDSRLVGTGQATLIIAEIGVNHDGSVERALQLVEAAGEAGADAVKFQIFRADQLMHGSSRFAGYQKERCADADPAAMLRRYELSTGDLQRVIERARSLKLIPLATPFSLADVEVVGRLGLGAVKIASPDLVNRPLLKRAVGLGRPLLLSTGAATAEEVSTTVRWMGEWGASFALLHCVSSYPTPAEKANLCWIAEMGRQFDVPIGYSDHTTELLAGALAVAAGASIVEKHLTYDRGASGPDHAASADPGQFAEYVRQIRLAERLCGTPGKCALDIEQDVRQVSRQSLVAACDLAAGRAIGEGDLIVQRPGTGIPAGEIERVVGRAAARAIAAGTLLQWDMLSDGN